MPSTWPSRLLLGVVVAVAVMGAVLLARAETPASLLGDASPRPTEDATPHERPRQLRQPERLRVRLTAVRQQSLDNARIYGRRAADRPRAVRRASRQAAKALQRYLNQAFVNRASRFSPDAVRGLLTRQAADSLTRRDRHALGVQRLRLQGGVTRPVRAKAVVLHHRGKVAAVTLRYRANMKIFFSDDDRQVLRQRGSVVFVPTPRGWRADLLDVQLTRPQPRRRAAPDDPPTDAEGRS